MSDNVERSLTPDAAHVYTFGPFTVDVPSHQLLRDGVSVPLTCKAFDTLVALVQHRDRVVTKDELMAMVWPKSFVSEDSLAQSISVLRRALGDDSTQPEYVATVPRRGYRFVAHAEETAPEAAARSGALGGHDPVPEEPQAPEVADSAHPALAAPPALRYLPRAWHSRWSIAAVGLIASAAAAALFLTRSEPPASATELPLAPIRFAQESPAGTTFVSGGTLSPDGRHLAFVALEAQTGQAMLWVRDLEALAPRKLAGTEGAVRPFWSPDSRSIAFFSNYRLRRVAIGGDAPMTIATVGSNVSGGTWNSDNTIVFGVWRAGLSSVHASGGMPQPLTRLESSRQEAAHRSPQFLPGGRRYLYQIVSAASEVQGTYVGTLGSNDRVRIFDQPALYAPPGYLLYVRDRALMAQPFNAETLRADGHPLTVVGDAGAASLDVGLSVSYGGIIAYGGTVTAGRLTWFDRSGRQLAAIDTPSEMHAPQLVPGQNQVLASGADGMWAIDLDRGSSTRLGLRSSAPQPSPDGTEIVFTSDRANGVSDMYVRTNTGEEKLILRTDAAKTVNDWSRDGRYIVYVSRGAATKNDIWLLPRFGAAEPIAFVQTPANEIQGRISPDGRWLAYASDESGPWEVYVEAFPSGGAKRTISVGGGAQPQWRADGRELLYMGMDRRLMAVEIRDGNGLQVGKPQPLFAAPIIGNLGDVRNHFSATADGTRFLLDAIDERLGRRPITVLLNWTTLADIQD